MYERDMLDKLRKSARSSQPPPRKGTLDPKEVRNLTMLFINNPKRTNLKMT